MRSGTLYVVGTPLGNLGDLSARVREVLLAASVVAAEDTRHSRKLLSAIGASPRRLVSYHAHSAEGRETALIEILQGGEDIALITDAGTPAVSDPGVALVAAAHEAGITVVPIPGPSAVATALSAGGLSADSYLFLGFVPRKGRERRELLARAKDSPWTVVFFEAANRLTGLLDDLIAVAGGERVAVVCRELTKLHEEVRRGALQELTDHYRVSKPLGEVTVLLEGAEMVRRGPDPDDIAAARAAVAEWLASGESRREAVRRVVDEFGLPRNDAYRLVMES